MSYFFQVLLKTTYAGVYKKCNANTEDISFGLGGGFGTREPLFCVQFLRDRCYGMNVNMCDWFVD